MELGIDIGEIDIVVLLGLPPSAKALWQRLGRAGRKNAGACLMIDDRGTLGDSINALESFLNRPLEPSWLYLENRYIQYAQALLCSYGDRRVSQCHGRISITIASFVPGDAGKRNPSLPRLCQPTFIRLSRRLKEGRNSSFPSEPQLNKTFKCEPRKYPSWNCDVLPGATRGLSWWHLPLYGPPISDIQI